MKSLVLLLCFVTAAVYARSARHNLLMQLRAGQGQGQAQPIEKIISELAKKLGVTYPAGGLQSSTAEINKLGDDLAAALDPHMPKPLDSDDPSTRGELFIANLIAAFAGQGAEKNWGGSSYNTAVKMYNDGNEELATAEGKQMTQSMLSDLGLSKREGVNEPMTQLLNAIAAQEGVAPLSATPTEAEGKAFIQALVSWGQKSGLVPQSIQTPTPAQKVEEEILNWAFLNRLNKQMPNDDLTKYLDNGRADINTKLADPQLKADVTASLTKAETNNVQTRATFDVKDDPVGYLLNAYGNSEANAPFPGIDASEEDLKKWAKTVGAAVENDDNLKVSKENSGLFALYEMALELKNYGKGGDGEVTDVAAQEGQDSFKEVNTYMNDNPKAKDDLLKNIGNMKVRALRALLKALMKRDSVDDVIQAAGLADANAQSTDRQTGEALLSMYIMHIVRPQQNAGQGSATQEEHGQLAHLLNEVGNDYFKKHDDVYQELLGEINAGTFKPHAKQA